MAEINPNRREQEERARGDIKKCIDGPLAHVATQVAPVVIEMGAHVILDRTIHGLSSREFTSFEGKKVTDIRKSE